MSPSEKSEKVSRIQQLIDEVINHDFEGNVAHFCRYTQIPYSTLNRLKAGHTLPHGKNLVKLRKAIPDLDILLDNTPKQTVDYGTILDTSDDNPTKGETEMEVVKQVLTMLNESILGRIESHETSVNDRLRAMDDRLKNVVESLLSVEQSSKDRHRERMERLASLEQKFDHCCPNTTEK